MPGTTMQADRLHGLRQPARLRLTASMMRISRGRSPSRPAAPVADRATPNYRADMQTTTFQDNPTPERGGDYDFGDGRFCRVTVRPPTFDSDNVYYKVTAYEVDA